MSKKTAVVMTYYNRQQPLDNTLLSLQKYTNDDDFYLVVIDDASNASPFGVNRFKNGHLLTMKKEDKKWVSPVIIQNMAVQFALNLGCEIIINQNAECMHMGDVVAHARENITQENYISYACYSLDEKNTFRKDLKAALPGIINSNNLGATSDGSNSWYNHPIHRAVGYDFCAAITRENIIKLNGYDERYALGVAYSDDDLVMRVKRLGLKIEIPNPVPEMPGHIPFVVHQWHYSGSSQYDKTSLVELNQALYHSLGSDGSGNYKAVHILTEDLK